MKKVTSFIELYTTRDDGLEFDDVLQERKPLFFCAGLLYRKNQQGNYEVLVIDYKHDRVGEVQVRFPGGTSAFGDTPKDTLWAMFKRELGYTFKSRYIYIIYYNQWFKKGSSEELKHVKIFFAEEFTFNRSEELLKSIPKNEFSEISNARFEKISVNLIEKVHHSHKAALIKLIEKMDRAR